MYLRNTTVDRNRCRCGTAFQEGDRFCRKCGTRRGEACYTPSHDVGARIYGPAPVMRTHRCLSCGHTYSIALMVDNYKYCPRCGGETVTIRSNNSRR